MALARMKSREMTARERLALKIAHDLAGEHTAIDTPEPWVDWLECVCGARYQIGGGKLVDDKGSYNDALRWRV